MSDIQRLTYLSVRNSIKIASGWGEYFCELYTDTDRPHYDSSFKREVELRVKNIKKELHQIETVNKNIY